MAEDLDVGMKCIKYMLFVANFMFVMIGFLLISIGSTIKAIYMDFEEFIHADYFSPSNLAIAIGVIIFFVALFGCIGALKESTLLINVFAALLTILLILEIVTTGISYSVRGKIHKSLEGTMISTLENYNKYSEIKEQWDFTQERLHCCGVHNSTDWNDFFKSTTTVAPSTESDLTTLSPDKAEFMGPMSCCRNWADGDKMCSAEDVYHEGCFDSLEYIVSESALLLGCGALAVAFSQILGIAFAVLLAKSVRRLKTKKLVEKDLDRQNFYEQMSKGKDDVPTPVLYTPTFSEC